MKVAFAVLILNLISYSAAATVAPFSLTISAPKSEVKAGSDILINIVMTNTSDHEIDCAPGYVGSDDIRFHADVRDSKGHSMKKTTEHPELMSGSTSFCTLEPGESITRHNRVTWLHDLSRPGTYTIQVSRDISSDEKDGAVKSNVITVTVISEK